MTALLGATVVVLGLILVSAPGTSAARGLDVNAGQFCGDSDHWKIKVADNGDTVQCLKGDDGKWRWKKVAAVPTQTASSSKPASPSASASASSSKSVAPSATRTSAPPVAASLPVTGSKVPLIVGAGFLLLLAGGVLVFAIRRARTEFR